MSVGRRELDEAFESCHRKLYQMAVRIVGNTHDAEDVLQETYLQAWNGIDHFREESALSTWLYRITVNCSLKYMKQVKSFPVTALAAEKGVTELEFFKGLRVYKAVEDEVLYNDMRETCLQMFLECLPRKQRIAFILKVLMDLSGKDVASVMEITEGAVKTHVHRARTAMKEALDGKCGFLDPSFPCQCQLWVNYAIENNKRELIPHFNVAKRIPEAVSKEALSEVHFLRKLAALYNSQYQLEEPSFLEKVKHQIQSKHLKIFQ